MREMEFLIVSGPEFVTRFMQAADVFERFKFAATTDEVQLVINDSIVIDTAYSEKLRDNLVECLRKAGRIPVVVHLLRTHDGDVTRHNVGAVAPYINPDVKVISNGTNWMPLEQLLESLGIRQEEPSCEPSG